MQAMPSQLIPAPVVASIICVLATMLTISLFGIIAGTVKMFSVKEYDAAMTRKGIKSAFLVILGSMGVILSIGCYIILCGFRP